MDTWSFATANEIPNSQQRSTLAVTENNHPFQGPVGRVLALFTSRQNKTRHTDLTSSRRPIKTCHSDLTSSRRPIKTCHSDVTSSRRPNMPQMKRVTRRLCQGLGLAAVWWAAVKVFMLLLVVDPRVLKENSHTKSVSLNSESFRRHGGNSAEGSYAGHAGARDRTQRSGQDVSSGSNNTYSSLDLDDLRIFHLENSRPVILERSPQRFNFIIKESELCEKFVKNHEKEEPNKKSATEDYTPSPGHPPILAVAVVSSSLRNWRERQFVRATWGHPDIVRLSGIPVVFMVGSTSSSRGQQSLVKESLLFRDIVQADFLDSYNNLSLKSMAGISWAAEHCAQANWVLKTDDDMCINVFDLKAYLVSFLQTQDTKQPSQVTTLTTKKELLSDDQYVVSSLECASSSSRCILCDKVTVSAPVVRESASINGVSQDEWSGNAYPPYCNGVGFLIPLMAVGRMVAAARRTRLLRVEDVFMTGVLARAAGLRVHRIHNNSRWLFAMNAHSKMDTFLNGSRVTLELDRDLEYTDETPSSLWRSLLARHGLEALGNTVPGG